MFVASRIIQTRLNLLTVQTQIFGASKLPYKIDQVFISQFQNNKNAQMKPWKYLVSTLRLESELEDNDDEKSE